MFDKQNYLENEIQRQEVSSRRGTPSNPFARRIYDWDSGNTLKLVWHPGLQTRVFRSVGKLPKEIEYARKHIPYEEVYERVEKILLEECRQAERICQKMLLGADEWQREKDSKLKRIQEESRAIGRQIFSVEREMLGLSAERQRGRISQEQYETAYREHWKMTAEQNASLEVLLEETRRVETAFSRKNPWLKLFAGYADGFDILSGNVDFMKKRIERIACIRFQKLTVELREQEWKKYFPEEWMAGVDEQEDRWTDKKESPGRQRYPRQTGRRVSGF